MNTIRKAALTVAGLGLGAAGVVGVSTAANADTPSTTPSASASAAPGKTTSGTTQADREAEHKAREDAFAGELAEKLGVDKDKVAQALEEIRAAHPRPEGHGPRGDHDGPRGPKPGDQAAGAKAPDGAAPTGTPSAAPSSASTPR